MDTIELSLTKYLDKCRGILKSYPTNIHALNSFRIISNKNPYFPEFVNEIESISEYISFVNIVEREVLSKDLERLANKEEKKIGKQKASNTKDKIFNKHEWQHDLAKHAVQCFFINTATYYNLWNSIEIDESYLLNCLLNYDGKNSEYYRLFVFDGFELYNDRMKLSNINLPVGELKIYEKNELKNLLKIPQLTFHGYLKRDVQEKLSDGYILTIKANENYRGQVGFRIGDLYYPQLNLNEIDEPEWENDLDVIVPIFLCFGSDANLAEIINVRTNIFDSDPVNIKEINGFLPHDNDEDGNFYPRKTIIRVGQNGFVLQGLFNLWSEIKGLTKSNILLYPTQSYVRAILNRHKTSINYDSSLMHIFVSIISSIESLLISGLNEGLLYKSSIRAASLMTDNPIERLKHFKNLNECYKIRSKIVHEGHAKVNKDHTKDQRLEEIIDFYLLPLAQYLLIRYMAFVYLLNHQGFNNSSLSSITQIKEKDIISSLLDNIIMEPSNVKSIEAKLEEWGIKDIKLYNHFKFA
jgi:hypothetical protein